MAPKQQFKVGDKVWAKMKGFPFWPGEIIPPPESRAHAKLKKDHSYVHFYGTNDYAYIPNVNINLHDKDSIKRYEVGNKKLKQFQFAVDILLIKEKEPKILEPEVPAGTPDGKETKHKVSKRPSKPHSHKKLKVSKEEVPETKTPKRRKKSHKFSESESSALEESSLFASTSFVSENGHESPSKQRKNRSALDLSTAEIKRIIREDYEYIIRNGSPKLQYKVEHSKNDDASFSRSSPVREMNILPPLSPELDLNMINEALIAKNVQPTSKTIGFLGLGKMGQGIVKNLLQSNHCVTVWNRTVEKCDPFLEMGAKLGASPSEVVMDCDIIFCCVSDADTTKGIIFGSNGVVKGLEKAVGGKGYVEMTSIESSLSQIIADEITAKGGRYLEVSLLGTRQESFEGSLVVLGAGDETLFADCRSCFEAMGRDALFVGTELGKTLKLNMIYNTFTGTMYGALAETLHLSDSIGLDPKLFLKVLQLGLMSNKGIADKGHAMVTKDYVSNVPLKYMQQSMELALTMGMKVSQPTLILSAANDILKYAERFGFIDHDVSAVYEALEK